MLYTVRTEQTVLMRYVIHDYQDYITFFSRYI